MSENKMEDKQQVSKFTKEQFVQAAKGVERDTLRSILKDGFSYSKAEVQKLKSRFLKRKVR